MNFDIGHSLKKNAIFIRTGYFAVIAAAFLLTFFILDFLWNRYFQITHTTIELACVYIELTAFSIIWNTYDRNNTINHIIGFGFFIVGIFDIIHIYLYLFFPQNSEAVLRLAPYYKTAGRLVEAVLLLSVSFEFFKLKISKWVWIISSAGFVLAASVFIFFSLDIWRFLNRGSLPSGSFPVEYFILAMYLLCVLQLKKQVANREIITYKYIFVAVFIAMAAELSILFGGAAAGVSGALEHILKICSSYYIYRGLFISAVTYPYEEMGGNNEHIESILNALPIGIITYDGNQRVNFANARFEELLGCSREFICGFSTSDVISCFPEVGGNPNGAHSIAEVLSGKKNGVGRIGTVRCLDGTEAVLSVSAQKLKNGMLVMLQDVKKEQELENIQLQTQTILNAINQAVLIIDRNNRIVMYNKAFEDTFEVNEQDMIRGMKMTDVLHIMADYGRSKAACEIGKRSYVSFDTYIVTRNKNRKELLANISQINNVDGELLGWVGVATDVTERKREEKNIQQQEKLALLGQMAAGIVHEIKNPLATIKGFNQIIKSKLQDEKLVKYAQTVENAINDVSKVANDFLSFARPRPSVVREISLNELMYSMQLLISSHAYTKGIKTYFWLAEKEKKVTADEGQIKQVILNFCENSIDAMANTKDPALVVSTQYDEAAREMVIKISDNGKGIQPEDLPKIGTPFFTTKDKGTGLGVSICYQIINNHNGKVFVESEVGAGTTFTITLPCQG